MDVRLNNTSQLAGFAKSSDLPYLLREICGADYVHEPLLAPTQTILDAYKKQKGDWAQYELEFVALMSEREIDKKLDRKQFNERNVLLCSEPTAEHCHRRLVLEYLQQRWGDLNIHHL